MANRKTPSPFKARGKWRAQVTLKNGSRPCKDFEKLEDAKQYIADALSNHNSEHDAKLDGPTQATLADALTYYAGVYTINKGGATAELNRINHYLEGAGRQPLRLETDEVGVKSVQETERKRGPSAFAQHNDERRSLRNATYKRISMLARKKCSAINKADIRELMSDMEREGLTKSTVQKEIALLRHMFNMAVTEWNWLNFKNPAEGIKLGKSNSRFVFLTDAQEAALWQALNECDNPFVAPWVALALETTLRPGSVNALRWDQVDLEGRVAFTPSKTGPVPVALSQAAVKVLSNMPRSGCGKVFPMSANAMDLAWDGARQKAGLPTLRLSDLRHLSATNYARRGLTAPQLQKMLGHKSMTMAQVYINLVQNDMLDALDRVESSKTVYSIAPLEDQSGQEVQRQRRSARLAEAVAKQVLGGAFAASDTPTPSESKFGDKVPNEAASDPFAEHALAQSIANHSRAEAATQPQAPLTEPPVEPTRATGTDTGQPLPAQRTGKVIYGRFGFAR
jgi:integrase